MSDLSGFSDLIARHVAGDGVHATAVPRLQLIRSIRPSEPLATLHDPALCIVTQGYKQVLLGERLYGYGAGQFLVVPVAVPVIGQVTEATAERPYLCFRLDLDPALLGGLMLEAGLDGSNGVEASDVLALDSAPAELIGVAARLTALLDRPQDIAVLAPLYERELLYRLLTGSQSARLRQMALGSGRLGRVTAAIDWIKRNFDKPLRIDRLAGEAGMSPSALHHGFKAATSLSPLQYQKQLRLQEARRLILGRAMDAASAAFAVGYESPSQFSREYSRLFGAPPVRDAARLRSAGGTGGSSAGMVL